MEAIINNANEKINAAEAISNSKNSTNSTLTRLHKLEDYFLFEQNFQKECHDFCGIINHELSQVLSNFDSKLDKFNRLNPNSINIDESKISTDKENDVDEYNIEEELKSVTDDINKIRKSSIETAELQLMMNYLPKYLNSTNTEYINQEYKKQEREAQIKNNQKVRALDILYEIQDFCAEIGGFNKEINYESDAKNA